MAADALTAQLPSAATAESAKEAVENALDNDDIAPLVRSTCCSAAYPLTLQYSLQFSLPVPGENTSSA